MTEEDIKMALRRSKIEAATRGQEWDFADGAQAVKQLLAQNGVLLDD